MSADKKITARDARKFVSLFRGCAPNISSVSAPSEGAFLSISHKEDDAYPSRANLVLPMTGETFAYSVGKLSKVRLRNLRCYGPDRLDINLCLCVECGYFVLSDHFELASMGHKHCPLCKAKPSDRFCVLWHSFGVCAQCRPGVIEECPFDLRDDEEGAIAAATHVDASGAPA